MKIKSFLQKFKLAILKCDSVILYKPLFDEIDYNDPSFPLKLFSNNLVLPDDKNSDPFKWATICKSKYKNANPYILIPGTKFDIYGTRHGKGGGWYDRFLSKIPKKWFRIGIIHSSKLSTYPILQNEWDQSVDWLI